MRMTQLKAYTILSGLIAVALNLVFAGLTALSSGVNWSVVGPWWLLWGAISVVLVMSLVGIVTWLYLEKHPEARTDDNVRSIHNRRTRAS
jgi:membrane protein implicated in regulation of membrane protease activity